MRPVPNDLSQDRLTMESDARFRAICEEAVIGVAIVDAHGRLVESNAALRQLLGYSAAQLHGMCFAEFTHPDDAMMGLALHRELLAGTRSHYQLEKRYLRGGGGVVWGRVTVHRAPTAREGLVFSVAMIEDITDRKHAEQRLRQQNEYLAALHETSLSLVDRLDVTELLEAIVVRAGTLLGADHGYMYLLEPDKNSMKAVVGTGKMSEYRGYTVCRGEGLSGKVWETGEAIKVNDYASWSGSSEKFDREAFHAIVGMPLRSGEETVGVIGLGRLDTERPFGEEELELLGRFAELASLALDNAHLYQAAKRQARELDLLHQVRAALGDQLDLHSVFRTVVEAIARPYGYTQVSLYLRNGEMLERQHEVGYATVIERIHIGQGVSGRVVRTGEAELVADVGSDPKFLGAIQGIGSEVCVPLCDGELVVGTVNVESTQDMILTEYDLHLVSAACETIKIAINRARPHTQIRQSEERFRSLVQNTSDVITLLQEDGAITYITPSVEKVLGYTPRELLHRDSLGLLHPEDSNRIRALFEHSLAAPRHTLSTECRLRHKDGSWRFLEVQGNNLLRDPGVHAYVVNGRNITERKQMEGQLANRAFHDPLTGLPNRDLFFTRLHGALQSVTQRPTCVAVLFLDLDGFKLVNDQLGHDGGDQLLRGVASRLLGCLRPTDMPARLAEDEFVLLLENVASEDDAVLVAERVLQRLRQPFQIQDRSVQVGISIGIALSSDEWADPDALLQAADRAMYWAKHGGKARFYVA